MKYCCVILLLGSLLFGRAANAPAQIKHPELSATSIATPQAAAPSLATVRGKLTLSEAAPGVLRLMVQDETGEAVVIADQAILRSNSLLNAIANNEIVQVTGNADRSEGMLLIRPRNIDDFAFSATPPYSAILIAGTSIILGVVVTLVWRRRGHGSRQPVANSQLLNELKQSQDRYLDFVENSGDFAWEIDNSGAITYCSPNAEGVLGRSASELIGMSLYELMPSEEAARVRGVLSAIVARQEPFVLEYQTLLSAGSVGILECNGRPVSDSNGVLTGYRCVQRDVTRRKQMEQHLANVQKMEAVGKLAGGVAHDFNNMLTVIAGHSRVILNDESLPKIRESAGAIVRASERAAKLTRQLLAFSRRQALKPQRLDVNAEIRKSLEMLSRVMPDNIELKALFAAERPMVKADPAQVEQMLINLVLNARDAMPTGGTLTVATREVPVTTDHAVLTGIGLGDLVCIEVADEGVGIAPEHRARIFEPFFTTKEPGLGTGLGLATVQSFVEQSGGRVIVQSEPGKGSTFSVYLPAIPKAGSMSEMNSSETTLTDSADSRECAL